MNFSLTLTPKTSTIITHGFDEWNYSVTFINETPSVIETVSLDKNNSAVRVTAIGNGIAILKFSKTDWSQEEPSTETNIYEIDCSYAPIETLEIEEYLKLKVDEVYTVIPETTPEHSRKKYFKWETDNKSVIDIENGFLVAKNEGTAVVKCSSLLDENVYDTCSVTVSYREELEQPPIWEVDGADYITLYDGETYDFTNNGIVVLDNYCINGYVNDELNTMLSCELEFVLNEKTKLIKSGMILKVPTAGTIQPFRVCDVTETLETVKVFCKHIFFDLNKKLCINFDFSSNINALRADGQTWMQFFKTKLPAPYAGFSNITNIQGSLSNATAQSIVSTLLNEQYEDSFIFKYGGELKLDWFNFFMNKQRGSKKNFTIEYGKNMVGIEITGVDDSVTALYNKTHNVWVYSPAYKENEYREAVYEEKCNLSDFEEKASENETEEEKAIRLEKANLLFKEAVIQEMAAQFRGIDRIDVANQTIKVDFINHYDYGEYRKLRAKENIETGDIITAFNKDRAVSYELKIIKTKYNIKTKMYDEITLGAKQVNIVKKINNTDYSIKQLKEKLSLIKEELKENNEKNEELLKTYALKDHTHDESYSPLAHTHDERYSFLDHTHDESYSDINHNHNDSYSPIGHAHPDYINTSNEVKIARFGRPSLADCLQVIISRLDNLEAHVYGKTLEETNDTMNISEEDK